MNQVSTQTHADFDLCAYAMELDEGAYECLLADKSLTYEQFMNEVRAIVRQYGV